MRRHLNIGREDCDKQRDQSPRSDACRFRNEEEDAECNLAESAQIYEEEMQRKIRRHHPYVKISLDKMIRSAQDKEETEQIFQCELEFLLHTLPADLSSSLKRAFKRCTVPASQIRARFICALHKFEQRLIGCVRLPHIIVHQDELR